MRFMFLQRNLALLFPSFLALSDLCLLLLLIHAFLVLINMFVIPLAHFYCICHLLLFITENPLNIWLHFIEIHFLFCVLYLTLQLSQSSDTSFHWVIKYLYLKECFVYLPTLFFSFDSAVTNYENGKLIPLDCFLFSKIESNSSTLVVFWRWTKIIYEKSSIKGTFLLTNSDLMSI